mgnify:CR=1 FL=1
MSEQLTIDFDPEVTAARIAAENQLAAAYVDLVVTLAIAEADARDHGLWLSGGDNGRVTVLVCPACGQYEANEFLISNNHGFDRHHLRRRADGTWVTTGREYSRDWCIALDLTSCHVAGDYRLTDRQTRMLDRLHAEVRERFNREVARVRHHIAERQQRLAQ